MKRMFCDWCETEVEKYREMAERDIHVKAGNTSYGRVHLELCERCALAAGLWTPKGCALATERMVEMLRAGADSRKGE